MPSSVDYHVLGRVVVSLLPSTLGELHNLVVSFGFIKSSKL